MFINTPVLALNERRSEAAIEQTNRTFALDHATVEQQFAELARRIFWQVQGLGDMECRQLAAEIVLPTETMSREAEIYDVHLSRPDRARACAARLRARLAQQK